MNNRTFRLLERLDAQIWQLLCEIRLASSLIGPEASQIEVGAEELLMVVDQIARRLQAARRITQRLHNRGQ